MATGLCTRRRVALGARRNNRSNTLSKEIAHPDKECSAVSLKSGLELPGERAAAAVIKVVVIADVKGRSRVRVPSEKGLTGIIIPRRVIVKPHSGKKETRELVR